MTKILFVCHGNICRSPMAEFVLKDMVKKLNIEEDFDIASAATSREEIGNSVYPPARKKLAEVGISCKNKVARQVRASDYDEFDLIIAMDRNNLRNLKPFFPKDEDGKIKLLMDYTQTPGDVADPWYTGDFDKTYEDVVNGCSGILRELGYKQK